MTFITSVSGVRNKGVEVRVLTNPLGLSLQGSMVLIRMTLYHYRKFSWMGTERWLRAEGICCQAWQTEIDTWGHKTGGENWPSQALLSRQAFVTWIHTEYLESFEKLLYEGHTFYFIFAHKAWLEHNPAHFTVSIANFPLQARVWTVAVETLPAALI